MSKYRFKFKFSPRKWEIEGEAIQGEHGIELTTKEGKWFLLPYHAIQWMSQEPTAISTYEPSLTGFLYKDHPAASSGEATAIPDLGHSFRGHPITCALCQWGRLVPENYSWDAYWKHMDEAHQRYQPFGERK